MILYGVEGETVVAKEIFYDEDYDEPLVLANTEHGPIVRLYDTDNSILSEQIAIPDHEGTVGGWAVNIPIPKMGLSSRVELRIVWRFKTEDNDVHKSTQICFVEPSTEGRESDIIVVVGRDTKMLVNLPFSFLPTINETPADLVNGIPAKPGKLRDSVRFSLYRNNIPLYTNEYLNHDDVSVSYVASVDKTTFTIPATVGIPKLEPLLLLVEHTKFGQSMPRNYTYKVWPITPQILIAVSQIEDFINKARLENVIPELQYTQADILQYLQRGLALFNALPPHLTGFTGTNMQGNIADSWLTCSSYYALASQLQAEGALAFDFSGQSVSLNVDRTPAIEGALSRVESAIDNIVKPFKKLLAKAGIVSGDGSQGGGYIDGSTALGSLSVINAPTTRLPHSRRGSWHRPY